MKRRTNLFYTNTEETNFLVFSNFSEHLTGNILATDIKLFPSRFLCVYIPSLTNETRKDFIQMLITYYENKLALCRDNIIKNSTENNLRYPDEELRYLDYLIKTIFKFDEDSTIEYISTVTEQDYNGTFTDIICTIDSSADFLGNRFSIKLKNSLEGNDIVKAETEVDKKYLYGWASTEVKTNEDETKTETYTFFGPSDYENIEPEFDVEEDNIYYLNSQCEFVKLNNESQEISFNIVIPLYDIVNINTERNDTIIGEVEIDLDETPKNDYVKNVPYGIWFANETVKLTHDNKTKYAPSWSLVIGTQFKPFPNSNYLFQDQYNLNEASAFEFGMFSQVLCRQNNILEQLEKNFLTIDSISSGALNDVINEIVEQRVNSYLEQNLSEIVKKTISDMINSGSEETSVMDKKWQWIPINR